LVTFKICHLASDVKTLKSQSFRAAEDGLWWPEAGLGKGIVDG